MFHIIYKITNEINKKIYVGKHSTHNIDDSYMGSGVALQRAFDKYGIENFTKEIIHVCDTCEDALILESEIVDLDFVNRKDTYNLVVGGLSGSTGTIVSEETRQKQSAAKKGRKLTQEHKDKIADSLRGKPSRAAGSVKSEEAKRKTSEALKGRTSPMKGKTHSEDTRQALSDLNKGRPKPVVTCPHCGKSGGASAMKRWHFDNCKLKDHKS